MQNCDTAERITEQKGLYGNLFFSSGQFEKAQSPVPGHHVVGVSARHVN
jgi:hypothetical protein